MRLTPEAARALDARQRIRERIEAKLRKAGFVQDVQFREHWERYNGYRAVDLDERRILFWSRNSWDVTLTYGTPEPIIDAAIRELTK